MTLRIWGPVCYFWNLWCSFCRRSVIKPILFETDAVGSKNSPHTCVEKNEQFSTQFSIHAPAVLFISIARLEMRWRSDSILFPYLFCIHSENLPSSEYLYHLVGVGVDTYLLQMIRNIYKREPNSSPFVVLIVNGYKTESFWLEAK